MVAGGKRQGAGRPKGSITKKKLNVAAAMAKSGVDPAEQLFKIAAIAMKGYEQIVGKETVFMPDYPLAARIYGDLLSYLAPKLKAIEHTGLDGEAIKTESTINVSSPPHMPFTKLEQDE